MEEREKVCFNCAYVRQGSHLHCGNPKQTDYKKIEYTYWPFTCDLFEETEFKQEMSDFEKGRLGYQQLEDGYWGLPEFDPSMLKKK